MKSLGFVLLLFLCTFLYLSSSELSSFSDSSSACSNPCDEALDQRISALERVFHIHSNASADASYLELAWMKLSSFAYNLTKPTDSECTFSWKTMQCAPKCQWYFLFFLLFFLSNFYRRLMQSIAHFSSNLETILRPAPVVWRLTRVETYLPVMPPSHTRASFIRQVYLQSILCRPCLRFCEHMLPRRMKNAALAFEDGDVCLNLFVCSSTASETSLPTDLAG